MTDIFEFLLSVIPFLLARPFGWFVLVTSLVCLIGGLRSVWIGKEQRFVWSVTALYVICGLLYLSAFLVPRGTHGSPGEYLPFYLMGYAAFLFFAAFSTLVLAVPVRMVRNARARRSAAPPPSAE